MKERIYHQFVCNQGLQIDLTLENRCLQFVSVIDYSKVETVPQQEFMIKLNLSKTETEMTILIQIKKNTYTQNSKFSETARKRKHS